ncbi:MAG: ATP-binding protein [Eudoraea sp.]|nr:ATP-binding protein [Eudoraea sp.]
MIKTSERKAVNPFQFGVVIDDHAFCNRQDEIAYLKTQIQNGYSTWLYSPRRFGKTSLVEKVFRELKDTICVYVDLYNIKSKDDFCRKYSKIIARELFNWKDDIKVLSRKLSNSFSALSPQVSIDEFGTPSFSLNVHKIDKQEEIDTILEVPNDISQRSKKRICIAFDEFQEISRIDPFMLHWMRSSFQRHRGISYIFLGSKQSLMEDIFTSNTSPFYEFASKMNLSVISREELFLFIKQNFIQNELPINDETINSILDRSECQPHFTQYFASVVFDLINAGSDHEDEGFSEFWMERIVIPQSDVFQDIFDQLTNSQRLTLQAITRQNDEGIFSETVRSRFNLPVSSSLSEVLKALQKKGLVYKSTDQYMIANPIFKAWLLKLG